MSQMTQPSMKWHNFITKVGLPLGAVANVLLAVTFFSGTVYEGMGVNAAYVYRAFPGLQMLDILYGACLILCGVYTWQTRTALKNYRKAAPTMIVALFVLNLVTSLLYNVAGLMVMNASLSSLSSLGSSLVGSIVGIVIHRTYYQKRTHLFVH